MPPRKVVGSLKDLCLKQIVLDASLWSKDYATFLKESEGSKRFNHVLGPFEGLTAKLLQELLDLAIKEGKIRKPFLHLLLFPSHKRRERLDLSACSKLASSEVAFIIAENCKQLKILKLNYCRKIPAAVFTRLMNSLPHLLLVDVGYTQFAHDSALTLFKTAHSLREVKLDSTAITDDTVQYLCRSKECIQVRLKLVSVSVVGTAVSREGALALLEHLPALKNLGYIYLIDSVFNNSHSTELTSSLSQRTYDIEYLSAHGTMFDQNDLKVAFQCCPLIKTLELDGFCNGGLGSISTLRNLTDLKINSHARLSYSHHLVPVLTEIGKHLRTFHLESVRDVYLLSIGFFCPYLADCSLAFLTVSGSMPESCDKAFPPSLTQLVLIALVLDCPSSTITQVLAPCLHLDYLTITDCPFLTDSILLDIMNSTDDLASLRELKVNGGNAELTIEPFFHLVSDCKNHLRHLSIAGCKGISLRDFSKLRITASRNFDIEIYGSI